MTLFSQLLGFNSLLMLLSLILYVIFGQVTVRRLRKNPNTRSALGVEFASGWDIINTAQALSLPLSFISRMEKSPLAGMYANSSLLKANTNQFDRVIARVFYWTFTISGLSMILLVVLYYFGVFPDK